MATTILTGSASGPVLASREGLSFWGGIDPATGRIIDAHHPLHGASIRGKILLLPIGVIKNNSKILKQFEKAIDFTNIKEQ